MGREFGSAKGVAMKDMLDNMEDTESTNQWLSPIYFDHAGTLKLCESESV